MNEEAPASTEDLNASRAQSNKEIVDSSVTFKNIFEDYALTKLYYNQK
jgi:hypothetical protein